MFAYCGNNPVSRADDGGEFWHVVFGAVLGGVLSGVTKALECAKNGDSFDKAVGQVLVSTACGAVGGALAATGIGLAGQVAIGVALGAVESAANQMIATGSVDMGTVVKDAVVGGVGGALGGAGAAHGSKFMAYHRKQLLKNASLDGLISATGKFIRHTWNWTKSNLAEATASGIIKSSIGNKVTNAIIQVSSDAWNSLVECG